MIKLRLYQHQAVANIQKEFASGNKHIILEAATGSGKTVIFTYISKKVSEKNNKVLILTNRTELLLQAGGACERIGLEAFYIEAGCKTVNNNFNIYIAMAQTLRRRVNDKYWIDFINTIDIVICDEIHLNDFNFILDYIKEKYVLGVTATPLRTGKSPQLGLFFDKIIESISIKELIKLGYLVNDDYYGFDAPDMSQVSYNPITGDYQESGMFGQYNSPQLYKGVIKNYEKLTPNTKSIVFCVNIEHTIKTALEFHEAGYETKYFVSQVSKPTIKADANEGQIARYNERLRVYELYLSTQHLTGSRDEVVGWFKNSKGGILVNSSIFTTGFDCPDIETVIVNRATISVTLWLQMIGRGSRPADGKTHFNILDFGGNGSRLGGYTDNRQWALWHEEGKGGGIAPVKECGYDNKGKPINNGGCRRLIMASMDICPFCGFKYPDKKLKEIELRMVEAEKIMGATANSPKNMDFEQLTKYRELKGYKMPWLWRQLHLRGDLEKYAKKYHWSAGVLKKAKNYCNNIN